MDESTWINVASSGGRPKFAAEAMAAAPPAVLGGTGEFLPATPRTAKCRLCGLVREMTVEHIPPKPAFNKGRFKNVPFEDSLEKGPKEHEFRARRGSPIRQGGIRAYTLCGPCNNFVGARYVDEYKGWAIRAAKMLAEIPPPREVDRELTPKGVTVEFVDVRPVHSPEPSSQRCAR